MCGEPGSKARGPGLPVSPASVGSPARSPRPQAPGPRAGEQKSLCSDTWGLVAVRGSGGFRDGPRSAELAPGLGRGEGASPRTAPPCRAGPGPWRAFSARVLTCPRMFPASTVWGGGGPTPAAAVPGQRGPLSGCCVGPRDLRRPPPPPSCPGRDGTCLWGPASVPQPCCRSPSPACRGRPSSGWCLQSGGGPGQAAGASPPLRAGDSDLARRWVCPFPPRLMSNPRGDFRLGRHPS